MKQIKTKQKDSVAKKRSLSEILSHIRFTIPIGKKELLFIDVWFFSGF